MVFIRSIFRHKRHDEEGQGTVEFALILPILLAILFGIIDFGWLFFNMEMVADAARSGARKAVVSIHDYADVDGMGEKETDPFTKEVKFNKTNFETNLYNQIKSRMPGYLQKPGANLTVKADEEDTASSIKNKVIKITVEVDIPLFTPVLWTITGHKKYHVRREVKMKREY